MTNSGYSPNVNMTTSLWTSSFLYKLPPHATQCCCLYLGITTLADLTNSAGTHLTDWVMNPKYSFPTQHTSYDI